MHFMFSIFSSLLFTLAFSSRLPMLRWRGGGSVIGSAISHASDSDSLDPELNHDLRMSALRDAYFEEFVNRTANVFDKEKLEDVKKSILEACSESMRNMQLSTSIDSNVWKVNMHLLRSMFLWLNDL
jgi:hypothetical protein